jgi:hypothetical protein
MFGRRYFGQRYFPERYFGDGATVYKRAYVKTLHISQRGADKLVVSVRGAKQTDTRGG